jgi:hypothetical protein
LLIKTQIANQASFNFTFDGLLQILLAQDLEGQEGELRLRGEKVVAQQNEN